MLGLALLPQLLLEIVLNFLTLHLVAHSSASASDLIELLSHGLHPSLRTGLGRLEPLNLTLKALLARAHLRDFAFQRLLRTHLLVLHGRDIVRQLLLLYHHLPQMFPQDIEIVLGCVNLV
jgi:hypothetical protein